jgi:hypothetical protein
MLKFGLVFVVFGYVCSHLCKNLNYEWITNLIFEILGFEQFGLEINDVLEWSMKKKIFDYISYFLYFNLVLEIVLEELMCSRIFNFNFEGSF